MRRPSLFSRRRFLTAVAAGVPLLAWRKALAAAAPAPLFEPIPPSRSGITWTHSNGRSADYYLPETTGAGCAFLDYDNDGWMDVFLVNSGPATSSPRLGLSATPFTATTATVHSLMSPANQASPPPDTAWAQP